MSKNVRLIHLIFLGDMFQGEVCLLRFGGCCVKRFLGFYKYVLIRTPIWRSFQDTNH